MATITTTLPDSLLSGLADYSKTLKMPKNKFIEKALSLYLDHLKKAEYANSYARAGKDDEIMAIAEEGMQDYLDQNGLSHTSEVLIFQIRALSKDRLIKKIGDISQNDLETIHVAVGDMMKY